MVAGDRHRRNHAVQKATCLEPLAPFIIMITVALIDEVTRMQN